MPAVAGSQGESYPDFRSEVRKQIILDELKRNELIRGISVSEREVQQCIIDLETNVVVNSDWQLSHILLPNLAKTRRPRKSTKHRRSPIEIYARTSGQCRLSRAGRALFKGPTALEGGSLGWLQGQQVPSIFTEVLQDMEAGDVSEPFRTANSIHMVKVDDLRSAVQRSQIDQVLTAAHPDDMPNEIIDDATGATATERSA